jgi:hypothetical protein
MSFGGDDVVLLAPAGECIADIILRVCGRYWGGQGCIFQDVRQPDSHPFSDPWVWKVGTASKDFFVYRSRQDADSWETDGAVKGNANTMFQFIIGDVSETDPRLVEVAVVFDSLTPQVKGFINNLKNGFLSLMIHTPMQEAAA